MASREPAALRSARRSPDFYLALGRAIKVIRAERGLERKELARLSGLSYPYLSEIEKGQKRPSTESVLAIARALELPQSELLQRAERAFEHDIAVGDVSLAVARRIRTPARRAFGRVYRLDSAAVASPSEAELQELVSRVRQLGADDFHRVLDLARRLTR